MEQTGGQFSLILPTLANRFKSGVCFLVKNGQGYGYQQITTLACGRDCQDSKTRIPAPVVVVVYLVNVPNRYSHVLKACDACADKGQL